mgnify:CR=1 FL=1
MLREKNAKPIWSYLDEIADCDLRLYEKFYRRATYFSLVRSEVYVKQQPRDINMDFHAVLGVGLLALGS